MENSRKTIVLGATPRAGRYAYAAVQQLLQKGHEVIPLGIREGEIDGLPIQHGQPMIDDVDTVTVYLNVAHQRPYYDYLLKLRPRRIIFNPGAENPELARLASAEGIEVESACTLVLLAYGGY